MIEGFIYLAGIYVLLGVPVSVLFVTRWITRIDPAARGSTTGFRVLCFPAGVLLWPWVLLRVSRARRDA